MDPHSQFCHNRACPASGQVGQGNIVIHSAQEQRYRCTGCGCTFSARRATPYFRSHTPEADQTRILTLVAHGCPVEAAAVAFGYQPRTIRRWVQEAGAHCARVQQHLVEQPRDLGQVQADELRVRTQGGVVWVAMALQVSTRLWLGAVSSPHRDKALIRQVAALIARCALLAPLLVAVDGFAAYVKALQAALRLRVPSGRRGRPRLVPWPAVVIGQVVKQYARRRVVGVSHRLAQGTGRALQTLVAATQGHGGLNTAYIERLNATFRSRLAALGRRSRCLARQAARLQAGVYLIGTVYNFCTAHASLTTADRQRRTPAMAAGITGHCWSVSELLHYQVPLPRWQPPKRRGRRSKELQALIARWAA
jgi:transposase-like protein